MKKEFLSIDNKLIAYAVEYNKLNWLSKFLSIKCFYENGYFYNYTDRKFAVLTGHSIHTARNWKKKFIELGWCKMTDNGHLQFLPQRTIVENLTGYSKSKRRKKIEVRYGHKSMAWDELFDRICAELMHRKLKQSNYSEANTKCDSNEARVESVVDAGCNNCLCISYIGLGELFGTSKAQAQIIIKRLIKKGFVSKCNLKVRVSRDRIDHDFEESRVFSNESGTFIQQNNRYFFSDEDDCKFMKDCDVAKRTGDKVVLNSAKVGLKCF